MKKILMTVFSLSLILTGCGEETPYEQMSHQIANITKSDALKMVVGGTIHSTNSKVDGKSYELDYIFNNKDDLIKADVDNVQMYFTNNTVYINIIETWLQKTVNTKDNYGIQKAISYKNLIMHLPKGNQILTSSVTGITPIDQKLSGKKLNDLVVSTGDHIYSIVGLKDKLTITVTNNIRIDYNSNELGKVYLIYSPSDTVTLPEDAKNATSIDNLGGAV